MLRKKSVIVFLFFMLLPGCGGGGGGGSEPETPTAENQAPSANAGNDQSVDGAETITLDGSASSDSDGTISSYSWTQTEGESVELTGASTSSPMFTAPSTDIELTLTFRLTVADDDGATDSDTVQVIVNAEGGSNPDNQSPLAYAGSPQTVDPGDLVVLDASASSDADGSIVLYEWTQTGGEAVSLSDANTSTPEFDAPSLASESVLTFQLTVIDNNGASGADTVEITVTAEGGGGTYSIGGTVSGLTTGILQLQNNGQDTITLSGNGEFVFPSVIPSGSTFNVSVLSQPNSMDCVVENGSGSSGGEDITNVSVTCTTQSVAWNLVGFGDITLSYPEPIVQWAFKLEDRHTGKPLDDISIANLEILEDGQPLAVRESFLDLEKVNVGPASTFKTVLVLDISSSLYPEDIAHMKEAIKDLIRDPETGESRIRENQTISLYTFDDEVERLSYESRNADDLVSKIDSIVGGDHSTNLYGAIREGSSSWDDVFTLDEISTGVMILVTDGRDTTGDYTKQDALNAVGSKAVYAVAVGSDVDQDTLRDIAGANNVFNADSFETISQVLTEVQTATESFSDGLHLLYYATPKRSGVHTVTVTALDHLSCGEAVGSEVLPDNGWSVAGCADSADLTYSADGLEEAVPDLVLRGDSYVESGELVLEAKTRWTHAAPNYSWSIVSSDGSVEHDISATGERATLSLAPGHELGFANVEVTDLNIDSTASKSVRIGPGIVVTETSEDESKEVPTSLELSYNNGIVTLRAETRGEGKPGNYYWSIDDPTVASLDDAYGSTVVLSRTPGSSVDRSTVLRVEDTANGYSRAITIENLAPLVGVRQIELGSRRNCAIDKNGVICWSNYSDDTIENLPKFNNPKDIVVGTKHACVLDDNGVHCWGGSPGVNEPIPALLNPTQIAAGLSHTCAIDEEGAKCWGFGTGSHLESWLPSYPLEQLALGSNFTCARGRSSNYCWGTNPDAYDMYYEDFDDMAAGQYHLCGLRYGRVQCVGNNVSGQLDAPGFTTAKLIDASGHTSCAVDDTGLKCWGASSLERELPRVPSQLSVRGSDACWVYDDGAFECAGLEFMPE